ncbi:MAG TPA: hypothetical protein VFZ61_32035, partial [Polyangiales bacterium]
PQSFRLREMSERLAQVGDLWSDLTRAPHALDAALERLSGLITPEELRESHAASTRKPLARSAPRKRARPAKRAASDEQGE